jgi:tyrosinase
MWQAIYPDAWIKPTISQSGSWTIYPGKTKLDESTPLAPFTTGDGQTPYTSVTSRYTKYFGYSYPDVQDWRFPNPKALSAHVKRRVNQLYNPRGHLRKWPDKRTSMHVKRDSTREWSVSVSVPNQAIGELFSVKILVGDVMIGRLTVLQAPSRAEVDAGMNRVTNGKFTLKNAITGDPGDVAGVIAQLKGNVKCIVVRTRDGIEVDNAQVKGLVVVVADEVVQLSQDISEFPTFGERTVHPEITL